MTKILEDVAFTCKNWLFSVYYNKLRYFCIGISYKLLTRY